MQGEHTALQIGRNPTLLDCITQLELSEEVDQLIFPICELTRDHMTGVSPKSQHMMVNADFQRVFGHTWQVSQYL
jgi:hypothetical protein